MQLAGDPTEEVANTERFRGWTPDSVSTRLPSRQTAGTFTFINVSTSGVFEDAHLFGKPDVHKITPKLCVFCFTLV